MTCAKAVVRCTLVLPDGVRFHSDNGCANPQQVCPRGPGEGYAKCQSVCQQAHHAEVGALKQAHAARRKPVGAVAYLEGHTHACFDCQDELTRAGVGQLVLGPPPAP